MGWASGSDLFSEIIDIAQKYITNDSKRKEYYKEMIRAFEGQDWDTVDECLGEDDAYDEAYEELYSEEEE